MPPSIASRPPRHSGGRLDSGNNALHECHGVREDIMEAVEAGDEIGGVEEEAVSRTDLPIILVAPT